jgi:hypothetical protein
MRLMKFLTLMSVITVLALIYTHLQMQIIDLAYQGKTREQQIKKLIEENEDVSHNVLTLKSAKHLGVSLLAENSDMHFADPGQIVQISPSEEFHEGVRVANQQTYARKRNLILSLLSFGTHAEAKTQE